MQNCFGSTLQLHQEIDRKEDAEICPYCLPSVSLFGTGIATLGPTSSSLTDSLGLWFIAATNWSRAALCARSTWAIACAPRAEKSKTCNRKENTQHCYKVVIEICTRSQETLMMEKGLMY